jgi:hypothetical protein
MKIGQSGVSRQTTPGGATELACDLTVGGVTRRAFYRTGALPTTPSHDGPAVEPFVCLSLVPAMRTGEDITTRAPVSPRLAEALPKIQHALASWYPELKPVAFHAPAARPLDSLPANRGVGCFFSGGVDSFYSVLQHDPEVDTLIFAHGFDIPLANTDLRQRVGAHLRAAASALGKRLVEVETNARDLLDPFGNWGSHTHGSALASVAHVLAPLVRKVYIPSSFDRGERFPWGSHPLTDPLWSSESVELVHDDVNVTRFHKTATVAKSDVALAHLRVCWENRNGAYNCGRCEKCIRTMMSLRLAGALDRCPTFASPLNLELVAQGSVTKPSRIAFYTEIVQAARAAGDREVADAAGRAITPARRRPRVGRWLFKKCGWIGRKVMRS